MKHGKCRKAIVTILAAAYAFFCGMLFFGVTAAAYIDPSVMTYLIQAVAGVAIALGAVFGIYFRRVKRFLAELFGIDTGKGKETESDDVVYRKPEGGEET